MSNLRYIVICGSLAVLVCLVPLESATAAGRLANQGDSRNATFIDVGNSNGGQMISFALQALKWKRSGSRIRFSGRCASACTLYLALSPSKMCIIPSGSFYFHAPYGADAHGNQIARSYMLRFYPGWVRWWLSKNGGLGARVLAMDYSYASQFIRPCSAVRWSHLSE